MLDTARASVALPWRMIPGSPAARAGLRVGDELLAAGERRLFGQADFRGVLHRKADPGGEIPVRWLRDGALVSGKLALEPGWRADLDLYRSRAIPAGAD